MRGEREGKRGGGREEERGTGRVTTGRRQEDVTWISTIATDYNQSKQEERQTQHTGTHTHTHTHTHTVPTVSGSKQDD